MAVEEVWGAPTASHLTTPPARWYGPVAVFLGRASIGERTVTHLGVYFDLFDLVGSAASRIQLDLTPEITADQFRRRIAEAGGECELASDLMSDGESVELLRVVGSGVVAVFGAHGRMTSLSSEPR
jgi:hypothetical protein